MAVGAGVGRRDSVGSPRPTRAHPPRMAGTLRRRRGRGVGAEKCGAARGSGRRDGKGGAAMPSPLILPEILTQRKMGPNEKAHLIPLCWPTPDGRCGCGRGHEGREIGKAPLLGPGYQHLHPAVADVLEWHRRWPRCNWGLLLEPWRLVVVDLDGREAVAEAEHLGLPPTLVVARGERRHYYYLRPKGVPAWRSTKQGRSRAIDLLAKGYAVVPPSRHASGDLYRLMERRPLAELPAWAGRWLQEAAARASGYEHTATGPWLPPPGGLRLSRRMQEVLLRGRDADPVRYPSRSEALYAVMVAAVAAGHSDGEILAALLAQPWVRAMRRRPERWLPPQLAKARRTTTVRGPVRAPLRVVVGK